MAAEKETELEHLLELRDALRARIRVLEVQIAQMGRMAPAHLRTELKDARRDLEKTEVELRPPTTPPFLDRMSHEEQIRYLVALVMGLQADFTESWYLLLGRLRWFLIVQIVVMVAVLVVAIWR